MTSGRVVAAQVAFSGLLVVAVARVLPTMREISAWRPELAAERSEWRAVDRSELTRVTNIAIARLSSATNASTSTVEATNSEPAPAAAHLARIQAPALELRGVIGGPPWRGVLRGLPGTQGDVVVQSGDRFQDLVVMQIDARGLLASWQDSTWVVELVSGVR